jgi:hypothetical protein
MANRREALGRFWKAVRRISVTISGLYRWHIRSAAVIVALTEA